MKTGTFWPLVVLFVVVWSIATCTDKRVPWPGVTLPETGR